MLQTTESDFNRQIYILASVHPIMYHAAYLPPKRDLIEKKYPELLNYIALLLVTKPRGDAAVTTEIGTSAIHFYYAKNRPCEPSTQSYVDKILKTLRENVISAIPKSLLIIVMVECVHKVRNRIMKSQKTLEDSEKVGISALIKSLSGNRLAGTLKSWAGQNDSEILRSFFNELQSFDTSISIMRSQPCTTMLMSQKAFVIGVGKALIQYPNLHRRIEKLGAYFAAAVQITALLKHPKYKKHISNIYFNEVIPPAQQIVQIPKSICTLLNEDATKTEQEHMTEKDFETRFPDICAESAGNARVTTSCHCKLILALRAIESGNTATTINIGVSKSTCWLCEQYLEFLSHNQNVRLLVSQCHGKIHAGWQIPKNTPEAVKKKVHLLVHEEVTEIHKSIIYRREYGSLQNLLEQRHELDCL